MRYEITTYHGESRSLFYLIDAEASEQPCIIATLTDRAAADALRELLNARVVDPAPLRTARHDHDGGLRAELVPDGSYHLCCSAGAEAFIAAARLSEHTRQSPVCTDCEALGTPGALCSMHAAALDMLHALKAALELDWFPHDLHDAQCGTFRKEDSEPCTVCDALHLIDAAFGKAGGDNALERHQRPNVATLSH